MPARSAPRLPGTGSVLAAQVRYQLILLARNPPALITESVSADAAGRPIVFGIARFAAARVMLVVAD